MRPATNAPPEAAARPRGSFWDARPLGRIPLMLMSLAGAAFLLSDVVTLLGEGAHHGGWLFDELGVAVASLGAVVLCWVRTTYAALASLVAMAASLAVQDYVYLLLLVPLMAGLAAATAAGRFVGAYLAATCLWMVLIMVTAPQDVAMLLLLAPLLFAATAAGRSIGRAGEQRERDRASISALHDRQARAVEAERRQIARDLHDIVAHDITIIAMQARAAARSRDPEVAARSLGVIGDASRDALRDLRVILRVLQSEAAESGVEGIGADNGAEAPGTAGIPASALDLRAGVQRMAQKLESLGHPTTTRLPDAPLALPKGHEATLYRILQEATTNIAKHAGQGSACSLHVRSDAEAVHLLVINELAGHGGSVAEEAGGTGILGMQDRVGAFGGGFGAGPEEGRWAVRVSLPIAAAPYPVANRL